MQMISVESTSLAAVGYDEQSQEMHIEFKQGGVYAYYDVPKSIYDGLMNASSHGTYFHQNIKNNSNIRYKKIG